MPAAERDSDGAYWRALGQELGQLALRCADAGVALGYHNHHWELQAKEGGRNALEWLFEGAAGTPLGWQVDVAWLVRGGADPLSWLQRYRERVVSAHAKDLAPAGEKLDEDGWADVGQGTLDWTGLAGPGTGLPRRRRAVAGGRARQAERPGALRPQQPCLAERAAGLSS